MEKAIRVQCFQNLVNYRKAEQLYHKRDIPASSVFYGAWNDPCDLRIPGISSDETVYSGNKQRNGVGTVYQIFLFFRYEV